MTAFEGVTPFPPEFEAHYREAGYWQDQTLGSFFKEVCQRYKNRIALVSGEEKVTYGVLEETAQTLASSLYDIGVRPRDRFIIQLPNIPEFVYLYLALQKIGSIPVMALPSHRYTEIGHFARLSGAVGYAISDRSGDFDFKELASTIMAENPSLKFTLVAGDACLETMKTFSDLLKTRKVFDLDNSGEIKIEPSEPALFLLSGGTTGVPKLIPRSHNDYIYNSRVSAEITDIKVDDALLMVLPMGHNFPLACPGLQGFLMHGARVVLSVTSNLKDIFSLIEKEKITHLELVPTLLIRLINDPELKNFDLSSVRVINSGGQRLQPEVKRRTEELIPGCKVQEVFGMAEGLLCYVRLDDSDEARYETIGRPVSPGDELRLVDDEGNDVAEGEVGELFVRGPYTLRGYFKAPEHNERAFTADGFYRSGDLMRRHPSGNYIVEGRKKDLINRGGEKISAEEIENLILSHPAVLNVACVPMPDKILGERVCAFIVTKGNVTLELKDVTSFLLEKGIAKFKLPERLELVDDLPLSKFGKVAKNVLVQRISLEIGGCND